MECEHRVYYRVPFYSSITSYLWVKLQLQYLKHCAPEDALHALYELPEGLYETYERMLNNFQAPKISIDRIRHVFECIAFGAR